MSNPTKREVRQSLNGLAVLTGRMTVDEYKAQQPKPRKPSTHPEADEQIKVIAWCRAQGYPYSKIYAVENERKTLTPWQAQHRTNMGVVSGVPDLFLPIMRNGLGGLYIEMKSASGRLSKNQRKFIDEAIAEGYGAYTCYSADQAINVLQDYCK